MLAPDSFDVAIDWVLKRSTSIAMHGASMGDENFSDFDYADNVALLTELVELLQSALEVFAAEAAAIGLVVNWKKTKIQSLSDFLPSIGDLDIGGEQIEAVTSFTYLGPQPTAHVGVGRRSAGDWVLPGPHSKTWITSGVETGTSHQSQIDYYRHYQTLLQTDCRTDYSRLSIDISTS